MTFLGETAMLDKIFVLMLENHSFDHLLGLSGIPGINGLYGPGGKIDPRYVNINGHTGASIHASGGALDPMPSDPPHEFWDVLMQLCGRNAASAAGGYPPVDNSGFVDSYSGLFAYPGATPYHYLNNTNKKATNPNLVMQSIGPGSQSVLAALASTYAVCDNWFSSMPGPTWPNRYFAHAASSAGLDDSPNKLQMMGAYAWGQGFQNGTIFDRLNENGIQWEIFAGDHLPQSFALKGMTKEWLTKKRITPYAKFGAKVSNAAYAPQYIFIEPKWGKLLGDSAFTGGNSQHPVDSLTGGEQLIWEVYQTILNSPHWNRSMLVITYDEHGGFYDHVQPPPATPPGDKTMPASNAKRGFDFSVHGVRVPAVIVSPLIAPGTVDHTPYDHSSIPATLCRRFNMNPLTDRDAKANDLLHLIGQQRPFQVDPPEPPRILSDDAANLERPSEPPLKSMPIKPLTQGFLNVAILKHQAIVGHRRHGNDFLDALGKVEMGTEEELEKASSFLQDLFPALIDDLREINESVQSITDERGAHEYIKSVIAQCERHQAEFPEFY